MDDKHPVAEVAKAISTILEEFKDYDSLDVLAGIGMVISTMCVQMDIPEEKAVYSFRKSYGQAKRRVKAMNKMLAQEKLNVH